MQQHTAETSSGNSPPQQAISLPVRKARAQVLRRLIAGFAVIFALLGLDAFVGFFGAGYIHSSLEALAQQQGRYEVLIEHLQRAQQIVASVQYRLLPASRAADRAKQEISLGEAKRTFQDLFARVPPSDPDIQLWHDLQSALSALTADVAQELATPKGGTLGVEKILNENEGLQLATQRLVRSIHIRIDKTRRQIEEATWRQAMEDRVVLAGCLLVSCLFLVTGTRIYYRMSEQSEELNRVSWQMMEKQELLAQRLSRELHDELGQSLTALKTNFSRHAAANCVDPLWMRDCTDLLKESIRSAHEISQLLRPTLLDDFGLDCALSWLCDRFEERNRIQVRYQSDFHWRLDEQAETHIFRIAQEALTNVVRHSEATAVEVVFSKQAGVVRLKISDNGVGLKPPRVGSVPCYGLTGMKARARSLEGEMRVESSPGEGVAIEVVFPVKQAK